MPPPLSEFLRTQFDRKHVRFTMVSAVAVTTNQVFLFAFQAAGMAPTLANFISVTIGCGPSYMGNRYWVWGKRGRNHFWREVFPFWAMALIGLLFSTLLIAIVSNWTDNVIAINATNLVAFGSLWFVKFLVLDRVLFKVAEHELATAA